MAKSMRNIFINKFNEDVHCFVLRFVLLNRMINDIILSHVVISSSLAKPWITTCRLIVLYLFVTDTSLLSATSITHSILNCLYMIATPSV